MLCDSGLYTIFYKCIGANDNIFDHFIFLNSVPTIPSTALDRFSTDLTSNSPFNLVPIGSPALLIRTQALSSNFTTLPSGLCSFFAVLTTTACLISPLLTLFAADVATLEPGPDSEKFRCFCTTQMMRSPVYKVNIPEDLSSRESRTNLCVPFHFHDRNALDNGGAGVIDAIQHRLYYC
jgi:hypothetical protein